MSEQSGTAQTPFPVPPIPAGATADDVIADSEFLPPITKPAAAEPLIPKRDIANGLRGQFTRDNQAATFRSVVAVVAAAALQMLYEMDTEQVRAIASLLVGKLGLPVGVVSGLVAAFEFWRRDR